MRVEGRGLRVEGTGITVQGLGCRVQNFLDSGFRITWILNFLDCGARWVPGCTSWTWAQKPAYSILVVEFLGFWCKVGSGGGFWFKVAPRGPGPRSQRSARAPACPLGTPSAPPAAERHNLISKGL